jgi:hypothetical protein
MGVKEIMKRQIALAVAIFFAIALLIPALATATPSTDKDNGAPNGAHFNLNIIGVPNDKNMPEGLGGNVIFAKLGNDDVSIKTRINLVQGENFAVLDKDGTDGSAKLQLMDPFPEDTSPGINTGEEAVYKIYIRALGKPGGDAVLTSGFTDENGVDWLSLESITVERTHGQSKFSDQTLKLTTIYVDITADGIDNPVRYNLFGNSLWDYFWNYDNSGLKLLQMRIYLCE